MDARLILALASAFLLVPAAAHADPAWSCSATAGWTASGGPRASAPAIGGSPCPSAQAAAGGATGLAADGGLTVDGGGASQTTDARRPQASIAAKTLSIRSPDGFALDASKLTAQAQGSCDANRQPAFTSSGSPGTVTLNGRPIDSSQDYSEPGVGVNGAPLFGKITIRFGEVTKSDAGISRRAIHVVITDRNGAVVFEAGAGEVAVGRDGAVCDPPPICPPGQQPQAGRCVEVTVAPLPQPPVSPPPVSTPQVPGTTPPSQRGCRDVNAVAGRASMKRIAAATLCLMNVARKQHHLTKLRSNAVLRGAAARYARTMIAGHFFAHGNFFDRIRRSGYLGRFGHWTIGENLGLGWGSGATPRLIMRAWMRSPDHRRNILSRGFHEAGVAAALGSPLKRRKGSITYVVDFGGFG
jgi:uncharacterized protein YkwD